MSPEKDLDRTTAPNAVAAAPSKLFALILLLCVAGCKSKPASVDDAALTATIQSQLTSDNSIAGQPVQVAVAGGIATLSGSVQNDAQRRMRLAWRE